MVLVVFCGLMPFFEADAGEIKSSVLHLRAARTLRSLRGPHCCYNPNKSATSRQDAHARTTLSDAVNLSYYYSKAGERRHTEVCVLKPGNAIQCGGSWL